jgi:MFS family permease
MSVASYFDYLGLTYCISLVLAYPLGWLADRIHPLRLNIALPVLYAGVAMCGGLFALTPLTFGIALVAHGVVAGSWATCTASIAQRLLPKGEFAQFDSAKGMTLSFGFMFLAPAVGSFLDEMNHNYRFTFLIGCGLSLMALFSSLVLHRKFMALGGPTNYVAPE